MPADGGIRFGNYVLLRRLARGGMAEVFLAQQRGLEGFDRRVAVKRILPHLVDSPDFVKMFLGEAKLAAQLTHPNVVHIYDFGKVDHDYFIAMEYVEGVHAGELFKQSERERMSPTLIARIGADAAAALHYAHELHGPSGKPLGLVHRDVSPANIMVSFDGVVKLCDFGIAKAATLTDQRTHPGQVKGKYAYMSPEQTVATALDGRSDVFSLAIVLWELLAGKTIVPRGDAVAAMRMLRDGKLQPIAQAVPGIPPALADAIGWALATRREDRATAAQLATALEAFIKSSPELATPMQLGAWVRARFPREALTGPQQAIRDGAAGPGTFAAPGTAAGGTAAGGTAAGGTAAGGAAAPRSLPMTPLAPRRVAAEVDDMAETVSVDPDARAETIILEKARAAAGGPPARRPGTAAAAMEATVLQEPQRRAGGAAAERAPPERPTVLVSEGRRDPANEPTLFSEARPFASEPPAPPPPPLEPRRPGTDSRPPALDSRARSAPLDPRPPGMDSRPPVLDSPARRAPVLDPRPPVLDPRPPVLDARLHGTPLAAGTDSVAAARPPRRLAVVGGLTGIAVASFLIALFVCSPKREAATPLDAPALAAASGAAPGTPTPTPPTPPPTPTLPAPADAAPPTDAGPRLQVYKVDTRPAGGTVQVGDERRAAPAQFMLPPGKHTVVAELDGWEPETRQIEIANGVDLTHDIPFTRRVPDARGPQTGTLSVRTTPYSDVYIGTRKIGQTPFADKEVPAGTYTLTFKNPLHPTVKKQVTVLPGKPLRLPPFNLP